MGNRSSKVRERSFRVGAELARRDHTFTVLVSDQDSISRRVLDTRSFPGLQIVTFAGPAGVGCDAWAAAMSRSPQEVCSLLMFSAVLSKTLMFGHIRVLTLLRLNKHMYAERKTTFC